VSACTPPTAAFSPGYLRYALAVLFLVNVVNMMDRSIMGVLLESIRRDMHLTDTQIGILTGFAFALFYAVAGVFIARLSDLYDRRRILALSVVAWSLMTAATGAAHGFWQFFIARMGVGVGESSAIPTSNAMIADYFPPAQRPLALAVFTAGSFLGVMGGSMIGGYVGELFGWRWAFVAAAAPGLPLTLLALTLRDPSRGGSDGALPVEAAPLPHTLRALAQNRPYLLLILTSGFLTFLLFGVIGWFPAFLMRAHALSQSTVGLFFGAALGLGMACGAVLGGLAANRLARGSLRWLTRLPLLLSLLFLPLYEAAIFASDPLWSLVFIALVSAIGGATLGPMLAAIQTVLPPPMRAIGAGFMGFSGSLIGLGGAPLAVGILSDHFAPALGEALALQRALAIAVLAAVLVTILLVLADRSFARSPMIRASS